MPNETVKLSQGGNGGRHEADQAHPPHPEQHARAADPEHPEAAPAGKDDLRDRVVQIRRRLEKFLQGRDYYFNPDPELVDTILKAMAKRYQKFGADYCPCRRVVGDKEKDALIICPCVYHEDEVRVDGHCHCQLFTREQRKKFKTESGARSNL